MNEYLAGNWQRIKRMLLELEDLGLEQRTARILAIEDASLRRELHRCQVGIGNDLLESPLVHWVRPRKPVD